MYNNMKGEAKMIKEEDLMREVKKMEQAVQSLDRPTKAEFMRIIAKFKLAMEQPERFEVPEFLRRD